jgi:hypothetical protein
MAEAAPYITQQSDLLNNPIANSIGPIDRIQVQMSITRMPNQPPLTTIKIFAIEIRLSRSQLTTNLKSTADSNLKPIE